MFTEHTQPPWLALTGLWLHHHTHLSHFEPARQHFCIIQDGPRLIDWFETPSSAWNRRLTLAVQEKCEGLGKQTALKLSLDKGLVCCEYGYHPNAGRCWSSKYIQQLGICGAGVAQFEAIINPCMS